MILGLLPCENQKGYIKHGKLTYSLTLFLDRLTIPIKVFNLYQSHVTENCPTRRIYFMTNLK